MKKEYSAGAVLYQRTKDGIKYILVVERSGHCGFPKGHIEQNETEEQTAIREIKEETGANAVLIGDFKEEITYNIGNKIKKHVTFFLAECPGESTMVHAKDIRKLHILPFEEAVATITHSNSKEILEKANCYINQ